MLSRVTSLASCFVLAACATMPHSPSRSPHPLEGVHGSAAAATPAVDITVDAPLATLSAVPAGVGSKDVTLSSTFDSPPAIVRVADVGAGLCVVARTADGYTLLVDTSAGHKHCLRAINQVLRPREPIDLVILTHGDADHTSGLKGIAPERRIGQLLWNGRMPDVCMDGDCNLLTGLGAVAERASTIINFTTHPHEPGDTYRLGAFLDVVLLATHTFGPWEASDRLSDSEAINAASIVVRLDIAGRRILIPGDALSLSATSDDDACLWGEAWLVERWGDDLKADVLIAGHHGAENASAHCFLNAVRPRHVILSAGDQHGHPRAAAVARMLANGVDRRNIFRTDRGSAVLQPGEWPQEAGLDCGDKASIEDDVVITVLGGSHPRVAYHADDPCAD